MSVDLDRSTYAGQVPARVPRTRHYLMCPPTHFRVAYAINPWMDADAGVDQALAARQWDTLRRTYLDLGHRVDLIEPEPELPDMVFAANGALVVGGRVYGARFRHAERAAEGPAYLSWFTEWSGGRDQLVREPVEVNEGEGDFLVAGPRILAGTGFRTEPAAHREAEEHLGVPVVSLQLVDPRFYHLDTALFVLDEGDGSGAGNVAYYPPAFSEESRAVLRELYPDALIADESDAAVLGLNAVCDGANVVLAAEADRLAAQVRERGYEPVPVEMSEFRKAGGGPKCCTLEIRGEDGGAR